MGRAHRWYEEERTLCIPYLCMYSYCCTENTGVQRKVLLRRCIRTWPESVRPAAALSDCVLDTLAKWRAKSEPLSTKTRAMLDFARPDGPLRKARD